MAFSRAALHSAQCTYSTKAFDAIRLLSSSSSQAAMSVISLSWRVECPDGGSEEWELGKSEQSHKPTSSQRLRCERRPLGKRTSRRKGESGKRKRGVGGDIAGQKFSGGKQTQGGRGHPRTVEGLCVVEGKAGAFVAFLRTLVTKHWTTRKRCMT